MRIALLPVMACTVLIATAQAQNVRRDVAYAKPALERQVLDIYSPTEAKNLPVVFWIHGGGWQTGDKSSVQAKPKAFTDKGFVFVSTNYRLLPNVDMGTIVRDVAKSIHWVHDHIAEHGGDPKCLLVMGHSAGAQLAALVCTDDRYLKAEGLSFSILKGCVPVDGDTYDVPAIIETAETRRRVHHQPQAKYGHREKFGNDPEKHRDFSAVTHVAKGKGIPPFLILYVNDHPDTSAQAQRLGSVLTEAGISAKLFGGRNTNHNKLNDDLGLPDDLATKDLFEFVSAALKSLAHAQKQPDVTKLDPALAVNKAAPDGLQWHDVTTWGVEGRILAEQERLRWFDRLPKAAEATVTSSVWSLSRDSAGMMVRFKTDATAIHVHYKVLKSNLGMPHMPATGVSGVDLYARDTDGKWKWVQVTKPAVQEVKAEIIRGLAPGYREYAAYLPLYNGVELMQIGVQKGSKFEGLPPREKPIVFYGTSITHGACASRPGMVHTAILGRRLDLPVVNLGFSGNGRMDKAVGEFLGQVDAAAFVIDCLPNMGPADVTAKCIPLVKQLRAAKPNTPIVLVEDRRFTNEWITPAKQKFHSDNHAALKAAFDTLEKEGISNLYYVSGDHLYGDDTEGATDASHANDLGFMRQADIFEPILRQALGR